MKIKLFILAVLATASGFVPPSQAASILESANTFATLAGTTVTSVGNTMVNGDIGVYPGGTITGFPPGIVAGTNYVGGIAQQAESDTLSAYNSLNSAAAIQNLSGQDLGGLTLTPGTRNFDTAALLTGTLTLDAQGDINAIFDFQIGSTLSTASDATVLLINGAQADNVFWQVGTSATLGLDTSFAGNILADESITIDGGTDLSGRALAINGAVTLNDNVITIPPEVPEPATNWLLIFCALGLCAGLKRRHVAEWQSAHRLVAARSPLGARQ